MALYRKMLVEKYFLKAQENSLCNTSYPLSKENWIKYKKKHYDLFKDENKLSIYIHIPFCKKLCSFCEYTKYLKRNVEVEKKYLDLLTKDIDKFVREHKNLVLYGLDIGGGTPTSLDDEPFENLMSFCKNLINNLELVNDFEPSIEGTFETINENKLKEIYNAGFKRISLGIQTMNLDILKKNNRENLSIDQILQKCKLIKKAGIEKINIDFMYGLEGQTQNDLEEALSLVKNMNVEQITLYEMRYNLISKNKKVNRQNLYNQYEYIYSKLIKLGYYAHFGQNTFSKNTRNLGLSSYLRYRMIENISYKGFGIAAQSKSKKGISYNIGKNRKTLDECFKHNSFIEEDIYVLPNEELLAKYIAISMYYGRFKISIMESIIKEQPLEYYKNEFEFLLKKGYVEIREDEVIITKEGFKYYSGVGALFYSQNVKAYVLGCEN